MRPDRHLALRPALKWRAVQLLLRTAPLVPSPAAVAAPAGDLARLLNPRARAAVLDNLHHLLPEASAAQRQAALRGVFRSVARYYVELGQLPAREAGALHAAIRVRGYEHFARAQAAGRGVIVAGIHLGPAEIVLQAFAARGVHYTAVVERLHPPQLARSVQALRAAYGQRYVYPDLGGVLALRRALRAGEVAAMLIDRDVLGNGVLVPAFGGRIRAPVGPIELARASGAPIVPATPRWLPGGGYEVELQPAFAPPPWRRGVDDATAELARLLARFAPPLRRHPDQWLALQPLFV